MAKINKKTRILTLIDEAKKGYDLYRKDFTLLESAYLNILAPELLEDLKSRRKSHITPQIIRAKVRKVAISVMKTYFENDEFAKLTPDSINPNEIDDIRRLQKALDVWTTKRINLYTRFKPIVNDALVYGTPVVKVYWNDGLRVSRVKIRDFYLDPNATSVYDIQYCVHRVFTTVGRLRKQFGRKFKWRDYVGQTDAAGKVSIIDIGDASRVEVMDVYRFEGGKWLVSTVLPDQTFIRIDEELKDGLPFIVGNVEPQFVRIDDPNVVEAYGASFIEPMIALQEEYTITRNQQVDAIDKLFNPQYLATKTSGLNERDLMSGRKKVTVSQLTEVQQIPIPRIDPSMFQVDRLDSEMQEVSGITKYNQGLNDSKNLNQTATGVSILTEEGNAVISDIIRALNESLFEPAIRRMVRLIYKYDTSPNMIGIDRSRNLRFFVTINAGVGAVNNEILLNNISAAEGTAMQNAKLHAELQDFEGTKRYLDVLDELFAEKLKALKLKSLIPTLKGELNGREPDQDDGGGNPADTGATGAAGGVPGAAGMVEQLPGAGGNFGNGAASPDGNGGVAGLPGVPPGA